MPHEAGNDFRFADWSMDLLEELFAESENALGLRCPAAVVIANLLEAAWRSFRGDFPCVRRSIMFTYQRQTTE